MKASDLDEEPTPDEMSTAGEWLCVVGTAVALVMTVIVWTFWT